MAKNLIPQIAQMLGVAIGEEFKIKDKHSEFVSDKTYKFSENALMYFHQEDGNICRIVADSMTLCSLLNGYLEVVKLPWKPKEKEHYYTFTSTYKYTKWKIGLNFWHTEPQNLAFLKAGWVFRTREEAEAALPKVAAEFGVDYEL